MDTFMVYFVPIGIVAAFFILTKALTGSFSPAAFVRMMKEGFSVLFAGVFTSDEKGSFPLAPARHGQRVLCPSRKHGSREGTVLSVCDRGRSVRVHLDAHPDGVTVCRRMDRVSSI